MESNIKNAQELSEAQLGAVSGGHGRDYDRDDRGDRDYSRDYDRDGERRERHDRDGRGHRRHS